MKRSILIAGWLLLGLSGCQNDTDFGLLPEQEERLSVELFNEIVQVTTTRVNDEGFCDGDAVGIYVVNYDGDTPGTLKVSGNQADNVKYTLDEANAKWTPEQTVYFRDLNTHVDLIGYYPYASPASIEAYPFEVAKDQSTAAANGQLGGYEASDFLWGKAADVTPTASRINVKFQHRMAGVQVTLAEGTGFSEGEFAQVEKAVLVTNTKRTATINLSTGVVTATGDVPATGTVPYKNDDDFRAIVVPQTVAASTPLFSLTVDGLPYVFRKDAAFEYVAGKLHKFTIEVSKKSESGLEFKLLGESITAWETDLASHDASAREYIIIHVPEASTESSALQTAIEADGKDYTKVKNMKVTGYINYLDFKFMRKDMSSLQSLNLKEVTINEYDDYKSNEIPYQAFSGKTSLLRFVFPDNITKIGAHAFSGTNISGSLIIPNTVSEIGMNAFNSCTGLNGTLSLPKSLITIGSGAFDDCNGLIGQLNIPESVKHIKNSAFSYCSGFNGELILPSGLESLGEDAFSHCSGFSGSLTIPNKITTIPRSAFSFCSNLNGTLSLPSNLTIIQESAFWSCKFRGELSIPEKVTIIKENAFDSNYFSGELVLPAELTVLGASAFANCKRLTGTVTIPENITSIAKAVFNNCSQLEGVILPKTLESIRENAFAYCYQLNAITCNATTPPIVYSSSFNGVAKDNFTVEVPEASVSEYATATVWKEFKRFSAYRDFSISRNRFRTLNTSDSKTLVLRALADAEWSVESKPDWVTVTPESGTGKTEVTITVSELAKGSGERSGEVVFLLNGKDYRTRTTVEQYDYEYGDGDVITKQTATVGNGVNIVFMGDCFDAKDIADGSYLSGVEEAITHFFAIEPYKTYKEYFNIYAVVGMSADSGVGSVNTIREAKFGSQYGLQASGAVGVDESVCFEYAMKTPTVTEENLCQTPIVLVENTFEYDGITYMWGDGSAIALCPMSTDEYPYDYRGLVQHEAGGHAFGKLGDEYIYYNSFIQTCPGDCNVETFNTGKSYGWYDNLSLTGNMYEVPWSHLIFDPQYSNLVDIYEGGFKHSRGVFRSESNSCMNNNVPYYSAISRESIVKRIMKYAGVEYSFEDFKAKDKALATDDETTATRSTWGDTRFMPARHQQAPKFMGEKPNLKLNR